MPPVQPFVRTLASKQNPSSPDFLHGYPLSQVWSEKGNEQWEIKRKSYPLPTTTGYKPDILASVSQPGDFSSYHTLSLGVRLCWHVSKRNILVARVTIQTVRAPNLLVWYMWSSIIKRTKCSWSHSQCILPESPSILGSHPARKLSELSAARTEKDNCWLTSGWND